MFGQEQKIQLAVLNERVKVHEEMVERVDAAIQTLSETNQNICKMLAVHDERIFACSREDENINLKVGKMEIKLEEMVKFRWMAAGVIAVLLICTPILTSYVSNIIKPSHQEELKNK